MPVKIKDPHKSQTELRYSMPKSENWIPCQVYQLEKTEEDIVALPLPSSGTDEQGRLLPPKDKQNGWCQAKDVLKLVEASKTLLKKLQEIEDHPSYRNVFYRALDEGNGYSGPTYRSEVENLMTVLKK